MAANALRNQARQMGGANTAKNGAGAGFGFGRDTKSKNGFFGSVVEQEP